MSKRRLWLMSCLLGLGPLAACEKKQEPPVTMAEADLNQGNKGETAGQAPTAAKAAQEEPSKAAPAEAQAAKSNRLEAEFGTINPDEVVDPKALKAGQGWMRFELSGGELKSPLVFEGAHGAWGVVDMEGNLNMSAGQLSGVKASDGKSQLEGLGLLVLTEENRKAQPGVDGSLTLILTNSSLSVRENIANLAAIDKLNIKTLESGSDELRYELSGDLVAIDRPEMTRFQFKGALHYKRGEKAVLSP